MAMKLSTVFSHITQPYLILTLESEIYHNNNRGDIADDLITPSYLPPFFAPLTQIS
jgi:hypothetical protein